MEMGGGDKNFRRPRGDKSSLKDDDCFFETIEFVCADFFIFVCKRGRLRYACSFSLSHTH